MSEKENVVSNKTHTEELIMFLFEVLKIIPTFFRPEKRDPGPQQDFTELP